MAGGNRYHTPMGRLDTLTLPPTAAARMRAAIAAQQRGDWPTAEALFRELTGVWPHFPDAWHYYGLALYQRDDKEAAVKAFEHARALDPDNFVLLLNLGRCLREVQRPEDSIECLERAHALDPDHAQAAISLAQSLLAVGRGDEFIAELERHLEWAGANWYPWMLLGEVREQARDFTGALTAFTHACRLAPSGEPSPHWKRAEAAREAGQTDVARAEFEALLDNDSARGHALWGLAHLAAQKGDFACTENLLRKALRHNPSLYGAWELLSTIHSDTPPEDLLAEMEAVAKRAGDDPEAWLLHFARGSVLEKLGEYDRAFAAYALGNRIRHVPLSYSREGQLIYTRNLIHNLDRAFIRRKLGRLPPEPRVIFICGMPRAGTTLVETILAAHPEVRAGGEQTHIHDWLRARLGMSRTVQTGLWLGRATDEVLTEMARDWRTSVSGLAAAGGPYVTDKLPGNYGILGLIRLCFPHAAIVHVRRDARDACVSCFVTPFSHGHSYYSSLESTGHMYRLYRCFMDHWRETLEPDDIVEVEYESLVREPEPEIRRLLAGIGLPWDSRCLNFHRTSRNVNTASLYQVRQPLYASSIGRWRHFERHLGPLIGELEAPSPL